MLLLVVDDNQDAAMTLSLLVKAFGNDVLTASNGKDAVEKASQYRPDAIIMDIGMPIMDGYEAARAIRNASWGKEVLLIALTGWGQDNDKAKTLDAGFDRHLVRPVEPGVIRQILSDLPGGTAQSTP